MPSCPRCGFPLKVNISTDPQPPWVCFPCCRAWWAAEVTDEAKAVYIHELDDFDYQSPVKEAVAQEHLSATMRGVSIMPEQVTFITSEQATIIADAANPDATDFQSALADQTKE